MEGTATMNLAAVLSPRDTLYKTWPMRSRWVDGIDWMEIVSLWLLDYVMIMYGDETNS